MIEKRQRDNYPAAFFILWMILFAQVFSCIIPVHFFQRDRSTGGVKKTVGGGTCRAEYAGLVIDDFIRKGQLDSVKLFYSCVNIYEVTEADHSAILASDFHNRTDKFHFLFQNIIGKTNLFQKIRTCFLEPADVVGMMNDIHLICFIILGFVLICFHKRFLS